MATTTNGVDHTAPLIVVSCDTHVGPRLKEELRPYCPQQYLDQFDDFVNYIEGTNTVRQAGREDEIRTLLRTSGHYDPHQRLRDLDHDGTAAEVIFHGSQNGEPIPFVVSDPSIGVATMSRVYDVDYEMAGVGRHIYNARLARFCSREHRRRGGLGPPPLGDLCAAIGELQG